MYGRVLFLVVSLTYILNVLARGLYAVNIYNCSIKAASTFIFKSGYGTLIVFMVSLCVSVKRCTVLHLISQSGLIMVNSMRDKEYYVRTYCSFRVCLYSNENADPSYF